MLVKIKVMKTEKGKDITIGEGVGRIGKESIDTTLRIIAYFKNKDE